MTAAGRNDRSIQEFATVDWMAYQGAPDGGVAGKSRISQWWTGSQCKEVNLPHVIVYFVSIFQCSWRFFFFWGGGGDLNVARGYATLPLVISMITNLTVSKFRCCSRKLHHFFNCRHTGLLLYLEGDQL